MIDGEPQRELYRFLMERCYILARGGFQGERGTSSSTLVGCKGLGKTTAFRNFITLAPLLYEDVIPIFITCEDNVSTGLADTTFLKAVEVLCEMELGWEIRKKLNFLELSATRLTECLATKGKYLLLIIDELDMLYQTNPDRFPRITDSLSELSCIGNSPSGRISCVLSGSSAMLEHLIRTNVLPGMKDEFAGLKGAMNLNGTKFATRRISPSSPLDLDAVESITRTMNCFQTVDWIKMVTFAAGANPREVQRVLDKTDPLDLLQMDADANYSGQNTLKIPVIRSFLNSILNKLVHKNFDTVIKPITEDLNKVKSIDWVKAFKPLTYADCGLIWRKVSTETTPFDLNYAIFHLADRGWINAYQVKDGNPKTIFPISVLKLVRHHMISQNVTEELKKCYFARIVEYLQQGFLHSVTSEAAQENSKL